MDITLTSGFFKKKYNKMFIANVLGWAISMIGSLADPIIGGLYISEDAVSATGLVTPIFTLLIFVSYIIGIGAANKYSMYAGAFDKDRAYKVAGTSAMLSVIAGVVLAILMYVGEDAFFNFYVTNDTIEEMAREYYEPFLIMALVYPIYWNIYYLVIADGNANLILVSDTVTAVVNAVVSLVSVQLIGVKGLAYGTIASVIAGLLVLIPHFFSKHNSIKFKISLEFELLKEMILSGSTTSLTTLYVAIIDIVMNKFVIVHYGASYLAAYAVVNLILNLAMITMCATDAGGPFIGVSYGEKNTVMLKRVLKVCTTNTLIVSTIMGALFLFGAKLVPAVYGIVTPEICAASTYATRVLALSYIPTGLLYEWINYMPRIDKPMMGNILGIVYMLIAPIALAMPLGTVLGYNGMVWGFCFTSVMALVVGIIFVVVKYGKRALPYVIDDSTDDIFVHEFAFNQEELNAVKDIIRGEMMSCGVASGIINKVELMLEETVNIVIEENKDKKLILGDCTLMINDEAVRLITRDNGSVFDITKINEDIKSLGHYVAARLMETNKESSYLTTISFNRNTYLWER